MAIKKVEVTIKGISPLLMNKFPLVPVEGLDKKTPEEQCEIRAHRDLTNSGGLYVPGVAVHRALIGAATYSKGKGRASLQKPVAACVMVSPERIPLGVNEYVIDSRAVVMPATGGRVVRHRPRIDEWKISFTVEYDDLLLKETELRRVVDDMGARVGLLDFRPERKGPFGRSMVTDWKT